MLSVHSADVSSPQYPDRPIRPLPQRRLKARLSSEQADSLVYPLSPSSSPAVFTSPFSPFDRQSQGSARGDRNAPCTCGADHSDGQSEDDEDEAEHLASSRAASAAVRYNWNVGEVAAPLKAESPTSSVDGYESFENTNNKKKRKIPLSGHGGSHSSLAADLANMGIASSPRDTYAEPGSSVVGHYYGTGASAVSVGSPGTGISGAGRGRFGRAAARSTPDRRPLGASTNGLNAYTSAGLNKSKRDWLEGGASPEQSTSSSEHGIISSAIANAADHPTTPQRGKENISLLQQHRSKAAPQKTQFTFTCESDSATKMAPWPQANGVPMMLPPTLAGTASVPSHRGMATHGTQTSPSMNGGQHPSASLRRGDSINSGGAISGHMGGRGDAAAGLDPSGAAAAAAYANQQQQQQQQTGPQGPGEKNRTRRPRSEYALASRRRRLQQEYNNYHHPPSRDEIWICEFCEYESIFGRPPEALVRLYEMKDRKEQKRLAEKRRLLDKAKMKNRKGKKGGKAGAPGTPGTAGAAGKGGAANAGAGTGAGSAAGVTGHDGQAYDQHLDSASMGPVDEQGDDYFDDDYDDVPAPVSTSQPAAANGQYAARAGLAGAGRHDTGPPGTGPPGTGPPGTGRSYPYGDGGRAKPVKA